MTDTAPSSAGLVAVLAHPDDESLACGGTLARCAEFGRMHVHHAALAHPELERF